MGPYVEIDGLPLEAAILLLKKHWKNIATRKRAVLDREIEWLSYQPSGDFTARIGDSLQQTPYKLTSEDFDAAWTVRVVVQRHGLNFSKALWWVRKGEKVKRAEWGEYALALGAKRRGVYVVDLASAADKTGAIWREYLPSRYDIKAEDWYVMDQ
jgi:hypothetical protein